MTHQEGHFEGARGNDIFWQSWVPESGTRAAVVLLHGASEHSSRYAWTAEQLGARGYATYTHDHRGHGRSSGARAVIDRMENAVADVATTVERAAAAHPDLGRPVLLGHSMGGAVALAYATRHQDRIRALALSAPAALLETASIFERAAARVLSAVAPKLGVFEIDSTGVSRDPEVVRDYDADPLNYHSKLPARTVKELADEIGRFGESIKTLTLPLLVMVGTGDPVVPPEASDFVFQTASSEDKTLKRYPGLYHEILNEPEREQVVGDLLAWLDSHT